MTKAIEGGTVMRPILKQVSEMATQLSVEPSGSSDLNLAASMSSMAAGESIDWPEEEGVFVPTAGVCKMGTGSELEEDCRGGLAASSAPARTFFVGRLTKRWMM